MKFASVIKNYQQNWATLPKLKHCAEVKFFILFSLVNGFFNACKEQLISWCYDEDNHNDTNRNDK